MLPPAGPASLFYRMADNQIPSHMDMLWPTLRVIEERGGSATISEILGGIAVKLALSDNVLDVPRGSTSQSKVDYRAAWTRTDLKRIGAIENVAKGVWAITSEGRQIETEEQARELVRAYRTNQEKPSAGQEQTTEVSEDDDADMERHAWRDDLLATLRQIEPDAFERLCQRVLRESGFVRVEVTGRSGDGGIDGAGVLRVNLISFHVRFQCKRYSGSVAAREIRDFRGAMVGRADKGLFLTTGHYTRGAREEASRDGAPDIDLVDGMELCALLKTLKLGVKTEMVENVTVSKEFFASI